MGTPTIRKLSGAARLPYHIAVSVSVALAVSFAAGVASTSAYAGAATERAHAEALELDLLRITPVDYFPARYQNQATKIEPLPPQF